MSDARRHWDRPAHFIGSAECHFGMTDVVSGFIISTVGDYRPFGERKKIGSYRFYETLVFRDSGRRCEREDCCGGIPEPASWSEIDGEGYQTEEEAREGHARMIKKCTS